MKKHKMETGAEEVKPVDTDNKASVKGTSGKKSRLSPKQRKIFNVISITAQIVLVVLAVVICLVVILNPKDQEGKVSSGFIKLMPVQSGSMDGDEKDSFPKGALIIAGNPKNAGDLEKGTIVTFSGVEQGQIILITHRIVEVVDEDNDGKTDFYVTKGDANTGYDGYLYPNQILAVYKFHVNGLGTALDWVREGYHFIYIIIIPLGLLLFYNLYCFASIMMEMKIKKAKDLALAQAANVDEDDIKRRAIEEYIKQMNAQNLQTAPATEPKEENVTEDAGATETAEANAKDDK